MSGPVRRLVQKSAVAEGVSLEILSKPEGIVGMEYEDACVDTCGQWEK